MAKFTIAELVAKFTGDTSGLDKAVDQAGASIASFAKKAAVGAGIAASALGALALKQIDVVGKNNDLAKSLGLSYAAFQNMGLVAKEAGVEVGALGASLGLMQKNLVEASNGSESANATFNALGLSIANLKNLTPDQQFAAIAEKIALIKDPAERTAVAMDIFGRSGRSLLNIFDDYGAKAAEAAAFNDRFNLSLSQVDAQKLDDAGDAMARIGLAVTGLGNSIAVELAPSLTKLSNAFTQSTAVAKTFGLVASAGVNVVTAALNALNGVINIVAEAYVRAIKNINKALSQITFGQTSKGFLANAENAQKALEDLKRKSPSASQPVTSKITSSTSETIGGSFPLITKSADDASESVTRLNGKLLETVSVNVDLKNSVADTFSGFVTSVGRGEDAMDSLRRTALTVIDDIIQNMFRLSFGGSTSGGGIGSTIAQGLFSLIGNSGPSFVLGKTAPPRKPFAKGGVVSGSQLFPIGGNMGQMGEKGPEAIMPLVRGAGGKLGVANHGNGGKSTIVNNNFSLGVQQTVRAEIMRMLPDISKASVGAVADAQNRNILRA